MIADSAPVPMPATTRQPRNVGQSWVNAQAMEAALYSTSAHIITALRPTASPISPANNAPKKKPMNVALPRKPTWMLVSPQAGRSTGSTKATTAASRPSKE